MKKIDELQKNSVISYSGELYRVVYVGYLASPKCVSVESLATGETRLLEESHLAEATLIEQPNRSLWALAAPDGSQWVCPFAPKRGASHWEVPTNLNLEVPADLGDPVPYSVMVRLVGRVLTYADDPIEIKGYS